jgi:hypothetical protein
MIPGFGFDSQNYRNKCAPARKNTPDAPTPSESAISNRFEHRLVGAAMILAAPNLAATERQTAPEAQLEPIQLQHTSAALH